MRRALPAHLYSPVGNGEMPKDGRIKNRNGRGRGGLKKKPCILGILAITVALLGSGFIFTRFGGRNSLNAGLPNASNNLSAIASNPKTASDPSPIPMMVEGSIQTADVGIYELVEDIIFLNCHWGFYLGIALDPKNLTHDDIVVYGFVFMEKFGFVGRMTTSLEFNSSISYAGENYTDQGLVSDIAPDRYITDMTSHIPLHDYPMCHYIVPRNLQAEMLAVCIEYRLFSSQFDRRDTFNEDREVPVCRQNGCTITSPNSVILILAGFGCAIAISVWIMHWRTRRTSSRNELPPIKDHLEPAPVVPDVAGKWAPQSLWKWRVFLFTGILAAIIIVPDISFIQINVPYYSASYTTISWPFISWYSIATEIATFYPFWWIIVKFVVGFLVPVYVGLLNSFKTRQAIRTGHPTISAKLKQRTIWGLSLTLVWILTPLVSEFLNFIYYAGRSDYLVTTIPLSSMIALSFGVVMAYLTFNFPHTRPIDFRIWAPSSVLSGPLYFWDEKSAQKLWKRRLVYTLCIWGILFGWEFVRIYFPYGIISHNIYVHYVISTTQIIVIVIEYFIPLGLGVISGLLTWRNFTRRGGNVPRVVKLMGKASVAMFGFAVISALISAFYYPISFPVWEFIQMQLVFYGGNLPALILLWKLQRITFEYPTSKARDFRWPPAVPGQDKGTHRVAGEQPPIDELDKYAKNLAEKGELQTAEEIFVSNAARNPDRMKVWHNLAVTCERSGNLEGALFCWDKAAVLGDEIGKRRGIQLRVKRIKPVQPIGLELDSEGNPEPPSL